MFILIGVMNLCEIEVILGHSSALGIQSHQPQVVASAISVGLYVVLSITVNASLLIIYVKGFHDIAMKYGGRMNINSFNPDNEQMDIIEAIDERGHELMLEASRYAVVFGIVIICDLIVGLFGVIAEFEGDRYSPLAIVISMALIVQFFVLSSYVYLSYPITYSYYEKLCCCHEWITLQCDNIARHRLRKEHLQQPLL